MKIVDIFASRLFAIHYADQKDNEYDRLMDLWNDIDYIVQFLKENTQDIPPKLDVYQLAEDILDNREDIEDNILYNLERLDGFFKPLDNNQIGEFDLLRSKGRKNVLRLYALRLSENVYVITGGAIKLPLQHLMQHREHTRIELIKINKFKDDLSEQGIFDEDAFYEFINE
ncbi:MULTISPECIES: hypothetical protein [Sphingobacterium]|uniref:hypothetical protein n=1 Tax=Sphingobacterium TaxID=28453 RepID=UPI00257D1478|nr:MULTISPECIES: hypothetical protein [Sphingobacterium]